MRMALTVHRWTRVDLASLPDDGNRYEVLDGKLFVTPLPAPLHQRIAVQLILRLEPYVAAQGLGYVVGRGAVVFGENELQPDVVVFPGSPPNIAARWDALPRPSLVVEILSATTRQRDLSDKRKAYLRLRVPDYWFIDPFERRATCWTPNAMEPAITGTIAWQPHPGREALVVAVSDLLR